MSGLILFGILAVGYSLIAARLDRLSIGAPIVFTACGILLGPGFTSRIDTPPTGEPIQLATEVTLALLLFADASTIGLSQLRRNAGLPLRLLALGLPMTIAVGTVAAYLLFPGTGWAFAALVAAILAPTDAALSLAVVSNVSVPVRVRQVLNVESGLNDGIVTPIVTVLIVVVAAEQSTSSGWFAASVKAIGVALLVAGVVGLAGGRLITMARGRGWTTELSEQLTVLSLAGLSYAAAVHWGGNGFVSAFAAGLLFGAASRHTMHDATEYTETTGLLLSFLVWTLFGAVLAAPALREHWAWSPLVYALLSLTLVRMVPVAAALIGSGVSRLTVLFVGWFGPRGLASIVFLILAVNELHLSRLDVPAVQAAVWTILLSVLAHGLTSAPWSSAYARRMGELRPVPVELAPAAEARRRRLGLGGAPVQQKAGPT